MPRWLQFKWPAKRRLPRRALHRGSQRRSVVSDGEQHAAVERHRCRFTLQVGPYRAQAEWLHSELSCQRRRSPDYTGLLEWRHRGGFDGRQLPINDTHNNPSLSGYLSGRQRGGRPEDGASGRCGYAQPAIGYVWIVCHRNRLRGRDSWWRSADR